MQVIPKLFRGLAALAFVALATACEDELPTATGEDLFSGGRPATIDLTIDAADFLVDETVYRGFTDLEDAPYLLVANDFDGVLDAHTLARFTDFPDSITFASASDSTFVYGASTVRAVVGTTVSSSDRPVRLRLYSLAQPWDSSAVTWTVAMPGVPWLVPGGTRGALLAETVFTPGDTARADTVSWQLDSLAVRALARGEAEGLLVTAETPGTRVQLSRLLIDAAIHPTARPDTTLLRTVSAGPQEFIFSPEPPSPEGVWSVGGITGDRTVLRLDLDRLVPACAGGVGAPACPQIPLRDVTLNRAILLLDPVPVPGGFRPLGATPLTVRRLLEPELGRRATLGELITVDSVAAALFAPPSGAQEVALDLTQAVTSFIATAGRAASVVLLTEPEGTDFGYLWFEGEPRLRLIYTLPLRPQLP